jgi:hypothetical protein
MRPYTHPQDELLAGIPGAQVRKMGRKRRPRADFRVQAVAKLAPHELDDQPESVIHDQIERDVQELGLPYITFRERLYAWLKAKARHEWQARELLEILKDFPDFAVFKRIPGELWCYALLLELKAAKGKARPGQKRISEAAGGVITHGYTEASRALRRFAESAK